MLLNILFYYVFDIRKIGCPLLLFKLWRYERVNSLIVKLADDHYKRQLYNFFFSTSSTITNPPTLTFLHDGLFMLTHAKPTCGLLEKFSWLQSNYIYIYIYIFILILILFSWELISKGHNKILVWECCINLFLLSCVMSKLTTRMGKIR